jgi:neurotransmitter:Na+ symporter, NSS family
MSPEPGTARGEAAAPPAPPSREVWGTRIGLVLAMAGNAIGLGNFLRFPRQVALNGGGAFMIPYFIALLLLGIPLMWVEWAIGRYGGRHGHGTAPGTFAKLWPHPVAKYVGALGIAIPLCIGIYYVYVEAWTLAFAVFSAGKTYWGAQTFADMNRFLGEFQGKADVSAGHRFFAGLGPALGFFLVTLVINLVVLWGGVSRGIERLAKVALPMLFVFGVALVVVVVCLGAPDPAKPENSVGAGFAFMWNPSFSLLGHPAVWIAAAGQVFFTLSLGSGQLLTYASYVKPDDDIVLSGLATASANETAEVVLGGSIAIPICVAFFGIATTQMIAAGGSYDLGFLSMPVIFQRMGALGPPCAVLWFALLFLAGITTSVSLAQPAISFLQDELGWDRRRAVVAIGALMLAGGLLCVLFLRHGFLDEMDFWVGSILLVVFALVEIVLFAWIFGMTRAWEELIRGAEIQPPRMVRFVIKYLTPAYLVVLLVAWGTTDLWPILICRTSASGGAMKPADIPYVLGARLLMLAVLAGVAVLVAVAWRRKRAREAA